MRMQPMLVATVVLVAVGTFSLPAADEKQTPKPKWTGYDAPDGLELNIASETEAVSEPGDITLTWELENATGSPLYVCQWPGITCKPKYTTDDGVIHGVLSGYPDSKPLARKYFVQLKPGEALFGIARVRVHHTPSGKIGVSCEYRSDQTGDRYGLDGWKGRAYSNTIQLSVPQGTP